jgi:acid phosphatase
MAGIYQGNLPEVVFFKPLGEDNEHPGYTNITSGEHHTRELIRAIENSTLWKDSLIIITYDENGGLWDHVAPPKIDPWGPGTRVPTLVIGPFAKKKFIDHTQYDTTSILKLIETRFGLAALGKRDAAAADMTAALELSDHD